MWYLDKHLIIICKLKWIINMRERPYLKLKGKKTSSVLLSNLSKSDWTLFFLFFLLIQVPRRFGSILSRLLRRDDVNEKEESEAELHFYAVSQTSRFYLHLQSSWNSFIIVSHFNFNCTPVLEKRQKYTFTDRVDSHFSLLDLNKSFKIQREEEKEVRQNE